jgi:AcrR family transcriptional regulator
MVKPNSWSKRDSASSKGEDTRKRIQAAASSEFIDKGFDGARMQAIAERAGANKAMIYYYFHSKEALYEDIIREAFEELFRLFSQIGPMESITVEELVDRLVHIHIRFFAEHPHIPVLLARELHGSRGIAHGVFREVFKKIQSGMMPGFMEFIVQNKKAGKIRNVDPVQTILNVVALDIFYFITKPVMGIIWPESGVNENRMLAKREKAIVDLILHGILPRK